MADNQYTTPPDKAGEIHSNDKETREFEKYKKEMEENEKKRKESQRYVDEIMHDNQKVEENEEIGEAVIHGDTNAIGNIVGFNDAENKNGRDIYSDICYDNKQNDTGPTKEAVDVYDRPDTANGYEPKTKEEIKEDELEL